MKNNPVLIITALLCMLFIENSCSKSSDPVQNNISPTNTADINIIGMAYSPASMTVAKGTIVKWTNNDGMLHTVTSNDASSFNSGTIATGSSFSYTATASGTYNYHCTIHGLTMSGTLIVNP